MQNSMKSLTLNRLNVEVPFYITMANGLPGMEHLPIQQIGDVATSVTNAVQGP